MQERLESTRIGRVLIAVLCAAISAGVLVWNLPGSELRRVAIPVVQPYVELAGLDQNWSIFAPDPRRLTIELLARIDLADGTRLEWRPPSGGRVLSVYRTYRWRKWVEWARADDHMPLWAPAARYVERLIEAGGRDVVGVELVRRWHDSPAPGSGQPWPGTWNEFTYYVLDADPAAAAQADG